jgi:uncharacterized heparinase superfamily protein
MTSQLGLTLRTARYLRPAQLVARAAFVAERTLERRQPGMLARHLDRRMPRILASTTDAEPLWRWPPGPLDPAARHGQASVNDLIRGRFTFLNQTIQVSNWAPADASRLWLFHLHGFSWAIDLAVAARRGHADASAALHGALRGWLDCHSVDASDAWHPFVVSERLMAWLTVRDLVPDLRRGLREPILRHAAFLERHVETDVGGNHLLKNLVALLLAGCAFDGPAPLAWRARAADALESELGRQVLPDGGHYERSPMYHLLVLADLLAALWASGRRELSVSVALADAVRRMQSVARGLVHPDGEIPLFNDSVLGEAPSPARLIGPSTTPAPDYLPETGYLRLALAEGVLIADCGPPGPDDLPAHVHADALSFELSLGDRRILVDGGVFDYTVGPLRAQLRGTAAHNTVQVDGQDQSEVWSAFRVGRRARVRLVHAAPGVLVGAHDGYGHLGVRHERRIDAFVGRGWRIVDTLIGSGVHSAAARLRLHPALQVRVGVGEWLVCDADDRLLLVVRPIGEPDVELEQGVYAERFNQLQDIEVVRLRRRGRLPMVFGCWLLLPGAQPTPG